MKSTECVREGNLEYSEKRIWNRNQKVYLANCKSQTAQTCKLRLQFGKAIYGLCTTNELSEVISKARVESKIMEYTCRGQSKMNRVSANDSHETGRKEPQLCLSHWNLEVAHYCTQLAQSHW